MYLINIKAYKQETGDQLSGLISNIHVEKARQDIEHKPAEWQKSSTPC